MDKLEEISQQLDNDTCQKLSAIAKDLEASEHIPAPDGSTQLQTPISIAIQRHRETKPPHSSEHLTELIVSTLSNQESLINESYLTMQKRAFNLGESRVTALQQTRKGLINHYQELCKEAGLRPGYVDRFMQALDTYVKKQILEKLDLEKNLGERAIILINPISGELPSRK